MTAQEYSSEQRQLLSVIKKGFRWKGLQWHYRFPGPICGLQGIQNFLYVLDQDWKSGTRTGRSQRSGTTAVETIAEE